MSIDRVSQGVSRAYVQNADAAQTNAAPATQDKRDHHDRADSASLSESSRSLAAAREAVQNAPDVREQKVAYIKQQVEDGTYQVQSSALARKMLEAYDTKSEGASTAAAPLLTAASSTP